MNQPQRYDVIVTDNLFGDILTDLGAALVGGIGLAASGNLNPARTARRCSSRCTARRPTSRAQSTANPDRSDPVRGTAPVPPGPYRGSRPDRGRSRRRSDRATRCTLHPGDRNGHRRASGEVTACKATPKGPSRTSPRRGERRGHSPRRESRCEIRPSPAQGAAAGREWKARASGFGQTLSGHAVHSVPPPSSSAAPGTAGPGPACTGLAVAHRIELEEAPMTAAHAVPVQPLTLAEKVWDAHVVRKGEDGEPDLIYIDLHLVHEVTSPQAFDGLRARRPAGAPARPDDRHRGPQHADARHRQADRRPVTPHPDRDAAPQLRRVRRPAALRSATTSRASCTSSARSWASPCPGITVVCGDSHTSTHGAFGAMAFGIGTSEVEHVLATQTLPLKPFKTMAITVEGELLEPGVDRQGHHPRRHRQDRHRRRPGLRARVPRRGHPRRSRWRAG